MPTNTQQVETILRLDVDYQQGIKAVGTYLAEIKRLKEEQDALKKSLKDKTITEQQYYNAVAKNKSVTTQLKGEMKVLTTEIRKKLEADRASTKVAVDLNASYNKLAATYKQMKQRINEMSAAERQANKQYIDDSKKVYDRMKQMQAETGKMQLNVGNYQSAIASLVTGNSKFASSLMGMTSGAKGMGSIFSTLGGSVKAFGQALMSLMTNPIFLAIAGIAGVGMAFKFWKDYNDGLAEATRLTQQFTQQTGAELAAIRDSVQATADVYGKDYKEVLQSVDTLVAQYGLTWKEANDIINKGFAAGADLNEDFLQNVQQYAPALKDAGLSAEELVAVLQQTRSGIFGKDGLDVITKASKNLRDMTKGTSEALQGVGIDADEMKRKLADGSITMMQAIQQVSGALKTVGANSQEAGAIISDVFGKKGVSAGQEQIKAIEDLNMSLDSLIENEGEYGRLQQEMVETQQELNAYTAALFGMDGWDVMKKQIELVVKKGLVEVVKWAVKCINYFIDWYNESILVRIAVQTIITNIKIGWEAIKLVFNLIIDTIKSIGRGLRALSEIVEGVFTFNYDKVAKGYQDLLSNAGKALSEAGADIRSAGEAVGNTFMDGVEDIMHNRMEHIEENLDAGNVGGSTSSAATGGRSSSSSSGGGKIGGSGTSAAAKAAEKARKDAEKQEQMFQKTLNKMIGDYGKMLDDREKAEVSAAQRRYELLLSVAEKGSQDELELRKRQLELQERQETDSILKAQMDEMERGRLLMLVVEKYQKQRTALEEQYEQQQHDKMIQAATNEFTERTLLSNNLLEQDRIRLEQAAFMYENAYQQEGESFEAFLARKLGLYQDYLEAEKKVQEDEMKVQQAKLDYYETIAGGISKVFAAMGESNEDFAKISKVLALAEIAINTGKAIAAGVAQAQSVPFPGNIAAIATTVATIMANIATAISTVKSAKFAKGGLITGPGTGTSDSITASVSNGESVMTANATALFSPLLSAINQLGGGVPIHHGGGAAQMGEDMLAAAIAKGYALAPAPVVSVQEISDVSNRVQVIENLSRS